MKGGDDMKKEKKRLQSFEIQPLNEDVLGNLSIEELEERLEMQILHLSEANWCPVDICIGDVCGCQGAGCFGYVCGCEGTLCGCEAGFCGADVCDTDCSGFCSTYGGCPGDTCISNELQPY
jgi:hypothetical protein